MADWQDYLKQVLNRATTSPGGQLGRLLMDIPAAVKMLQYGVSDVGLGPGGTLAVTTSEPVPGGDVQALGDFMLVNPTLDPNLAQAIMEQHERGHTRQQELLGPLAPAVSALVQGGAYLAGAEDPYMLDPMERGAPGMSRIDQWLSGEPLLKYLKP